MRISPSQIRLFESCPRAWYYSRRAARGEQTWSQRLGDEVQDHLDAFLKHGVVPPLDALSLNGKQTGRIALAGLKYLPAPGASNLIEFPFAVELVDDIELVGRMDCYRPSSDLIVDHKTTWSLVRNAMGPTEFEYDAQRLSYGFAHFVLEPQADEVTTRWVYYQTARPYQALALERTDTRRSLSPGVDRLRRVALSMKVLRDDFKGCEQRFDFCTAYGGCPYFEQCYKDQPEGHTMSVIEDLRKKQAARRAAQQTIDVEAKDKPAEPMIGQGAADAAVDVPSREPAPRKRGRPAGAKNKKPAPEAVQQDSDPAMLEKVARTVLVRVLREMATELEGEQQ